MVTSAMYRLLLWELIGALDSGKYDSLDIEDVKRHADNRIISTFLREHFDAEHDLSGIFNDQDWATINETWADLARTVNAPRKFGVRNKGISLLMAYALESEQILASQEKAGGLAR
jgi:hypothetical protein